MNLNIKLEILSDKECRKGIDDIIQEIKCQPASSERSLAITKLQEGVMWLGMDLKRINEANPGASENPYPHSYNNSNTIIEPTSDGLKF